MRNGKAAAQYSRRVSRYLALPGNEKRALLEGLRQELLEFEEANSNAAYETIAEAFGEPHAAARELMESAGFTPNPKAARLRRIIILGIIATLASSVIGLTCWLLSVLSNQEVEVTETIYVGEAISIDEMTQMESHEKD